MGKAAIAGVGATRFYRRGESVPRTVLDMACEAIRAAVDDAGLTVAEIDGFALYAHSDELDPGRIAQTLGIKELTFSATLTGGGGGSAGAVGLAATAVTSGQARVVVTVMSVQQAQHRLGAAFAVDTTSGGAYGPGGGDPDKDFVAHAGLMAPGQMVALLAQRHMFEYGTTREHFAEVALSARLHASTRPTALRREPLTMEDYFSARMISDPLCLYDFCMESDGAAAVVTVSAERARDLAQPVVDILGAAHGGPGRWGKAFTWMQMPQEYFASSGHRSIAARLYRAAGVEPDDIDVAELYDHFTPGVIMQIEDYGFCKIGEGGSFVSDGSIRWPHGRLPVNTHGGNHSDAYIIGMTHVIEAVEQMRGTAVNQVDGARLALATGGPAPIPTSGLILAAAS
ncbi:MAG: thiolase [Rhodococcus sp. (in: high G+C Gram-positive bacteria)]|uniref:thiolase C-terminal domain-containing protein n=1 Tax=Rhodococcus sp. TaxID=1831 RepID=UPI003BAFF30B